MRNKLIVLLALAAVWNRPAPAQSAIQQNIQHNNNGYGVDFWREPEGFSQSRVRAILQTRDGYIWLGTDGGLVRFNGESFTAFTTQTGALKDNEVWALEEDSDGGLWIGTYGGGLTLLKNGQFQTFTMAEGLPDDVVMHLSKDSQNNIWMVTSQGLVRHSHGVFTRITPENGLAGPSVTEICSLPGSVLVATPNGVYRSLLNKPDKFEPLADSKIVDHGAPEHLVCARDGSVWIGFSRGFVEQHKNGVVKTFELPRNTTGRVSHLYEDPHGGVWAVRGKRIAKLQNDKFEDVPVQGDAAGLGNIYSLCMDREDGLWVGLQANGLARLRTRQLSTVSVEDGLPEERTRAVFEDRRGDLWVGTADGLARYHNGRFQSWTEVNGARLGDVRSIAEDSTGTLWLSSGKDLFWMKDSRLTPVPHWAGSLEIEVLYEDARGHLWIGTDGAGLFEYSGGEFKNYRTPDGLASNHVRALLGEHRGGSGAALWISTFGNGVSKYANGRFTNLTTKNGLAGDRVVAMHEDEEGAIWFATRRGLSRLKDGTFFTWTSESGLFTNFAYAIVDDGRGNFWFSSAQGIFKAAKKDLRDFAAGRINKIVPVAYGEKDGMRTRAGNLGSQPVALKTSAGQMLFTSMKGLVVVDPERIVADTFVPPVYIEKVILNQQEQLLGRPAQLPVGAGELEIHYAALDYSAPEKMRFRYRLEGIDPDWIDAGGRRFTYYANLSPRSYRFRVAARKADGAWTEAAVAYSFELRPPFYRTSLFIALLITSVLLAAGLVYWMHMQELKARYSAVLAERNRISQDIHDTLAQNLAGIALRLDAVTMRLPDLNSDLREQIDEACHLTRYSLAEARRAIGDLRSNELEALDLSAALPEIAARLAAVLPTRVRVFGAPRKLHPTTETNLLRIAQEALANIVKHADAHTAEVELSYAADHLALRVCDDGQGFDPEHLSLTGSGHYGLIGMRERAERIGGHFTLHSRPGRGTELLVKVPLGSTHE
jgi:signal transduction histidine kinase/ligand-binding sensor domain-containing protein